MNATLYVPEGTSGEYKATDGWMDFDNIEDGMPSGIQSAPISQPSSSVLYDLSGRKLEQKPSKGIYIQNRKVLSKWAENQILEQRMQRMLAFNLLSRDEIRP